MKNFFIKVFCTNAPNTPNRYSFVDAPSVSTIQFSGNRREDEVYYQLVIENFLIETTLPMEGELVYINFDTGFISGGQNAAFRNLKIKEGEIAVKKVSSEWKDAYNLTKIWCGSEHYLCATNYGNIVWDRGFDPKNRTTQEDENGIFRDYFFKWLDGKQYLLECKDQKFYHQVNGVWENWFYSQE